MRNKSPQDTFDYKKNSLYHLNHFPVRLDQLSIRVVMCRHHNLGKFAFETRVIILVHHVSLSPIQTLNFVGTPFHVSRFLCRLKQRPIIAQRRRATRCPTAPRNSTCRQYSSSRCIFHFWLLPNIRFAFSIIASTMSGSFFNCLDRSSKTEPVLEETYSISSCA
jgi:hypothetical protein